MKNLDVKEQLFYYQIVKKILNFIRFGLLLISCFFMGYTCCRHIYDLKPSEIEKFFNLFYVVMISIFGFYYMHVSFKIKNLKKQPDLDYEI